MPPEGVDPGSPADWLGHATSDLTLARAGPIEGVLFEDLCFHAQQAAEKALKAVLVLRSTPFPRTHSIRTLLDLLPPAVDFPSELREAAILTDYAVSSRYPGAVERVDANEYEHAIRLAAAVVSWAQTCVRDR